MNIQWYPGHMTKARRQLKEKLKIIDLVIEVLDARAPRSSVNPDFEDLFSAKMRFYILNKSDLADANVTQQWISYYKEKGINAVSYSATKGNIDRLKSEIVAAGEPLLARYRQKGVNKTLRGLVAGIPNVGKSAILNRLVGEKRFKEGNKPGVTKGLQWAKIDSYLEIMDSPGLLWPKFSDEKTGAVVALIGSIKLDILDEEELCYYLVSMLMNSAPHMLLERYKLDSLPNSASAVLETIAKKRGFLLKGGVLDMERTTKTMLDEFKNGKMGRISLEIPRAD